MIPIRYKIQSIGGSHAQRDLFNKLLINSAFKAKNYELANVLLSERLDFNPNAPQAWKLYANSWEGLNKHEKAKEALNRYESIIHKYKI